MGRVVSLEAAVAIRSTHGKKRKAVLATGIFDLLHVEHVRFLRSAKDEGSTLFVGIERDERARKLKGEGRPINSEEKRAEIISSLKVVDLVFLLPENLGTREGREQIIKNLRPDVYCVSASTPFLEEKERILRKFGGRLKVIRPHNPQISTTQLIAAKHNTRTSKQRSNI